MAALNVSAILDALCTSHGDKFIRAEVSTWIGAAAPAKAAKKVKAKAAPASDVSSSDAEDKPKRAQSDGQKAWNAFINHVCGPKGSETAGFSAWLESHDGIKGNRRMVYAKEMRGEDDAEYNAFKTEFKSSSSSSTVSGDGDGGAAPAEKPKPKVKAKATKKAGSVAAGGGLLLTDSEDEAPKKVKAKKAPGAPKKAPKPSALPPLPASDEEDSISRIELFDQEFFWDSDTNALYEVKENGTRGEVVGSYDGHNAHFA
jgi:hypothetical protein